MLLRSGLLEALGIPHGFATAALGDARLAAVREAVGLAGGWAAPIATSRQSHGIAVHWPCPGEGEVEADALLARSRQGVGVYTADCVPILLAEPKARLVAAVHAGWRGTLAGTLTQAIEELRGAGAEPSQLRAV
ncbi:MAG: polyphenol oxidase family protein, partial [Deltaproteobacteria bacterium]